ncbi:hypothetical protein C5F59_006225 [Streptomyces sp. QL37]|uniref:hypothetical protein n=1 Tax=Streptomyces sp. QL37 TaxID=2093747 RepID=UPI0011B03DB9|nr:hypothetical protein [Streptomyces sp. QL37]
MTFDPTRFTCELLAGELADEWVELVADGNYGPTSATRYRQTIDAFCTHVDATVPRPHQATLGGTDPDLHHAVTEWVRLLPSRHRPGSRTPAWHAGRLRTLIGRRSLHAERVVAGHLHGWLEGALGLRRGETTELDEFSRADRKKIVQAAWTARLEVERRLARGWELVGRGQDPREGGWTEEANLLWAIAHNTLNCTQISKALPSWRNMPPSLQRLAPDGARPTAAKATVVRGLVKQLFLHNADLQPYRILLMAATGRAPEEVAALTEDDIEFGSSSVTIDFSKGRARARMRQAFSTPEPSSPALLHPARPRLDAGDICRRMLELNRPLAERFGISPVPLFLRAAMFWPEVTPARLDRTSTFVGWLQERGLTVGGQPDIRRLRKSSKVEKAIAFKGRVSDIADDHSAQTFHRHYAHGTTLNVIAGSVITAAQKRWLDKALAGSVVLGEEAERSLGEPGSAAALGLTEDEVEHLRTGQLDMGVSSCKDPFASPYGRAGELCPVAPTRCLECRNAFVLPSNLPQLLLFSDHLERLQLRLTPQLFHALWGQSRVNVTEAIKARTDAEVAHARRQIAEGNAALPLPLSAHVEFDA